MAARVRTRRGGAGPPATVKWRALAAALAAAALWQVAAAAPPEDGVEGVALGDVIRGWRVFHEKRCVHCHAVWGEGGQVGPDLGRTYRGHLSAGELAGGMWNHMPRMLAMMREYQVPEVILTRGEMTDLFSFLYFVRYLDEPGNPREGRRILQDKQCTNCHALEQGGREIGPDLTRWAGFVNPIVWAQMMWEHSAGMAEAMRRANIEWPVLGDEDLVNIIAYVRSAGTSGQKVYLRPGSSANGRRLFTARKCAACHAADPQNKPAAPDLARVELPRSLSALASRMWNHLPAMRKLMVEQGVNVTELTAQDMADIIAYLFARQYEGEPGDPLRGKQVFEQKQCAQCHGFLPVPAEASTGRDPVSAVGMGHAIWQHGARMAEQMVLAGIPWPSFEGTQMADLIAYVESVGKLQLRPELAGRTKPRGPNESKPK